jgi:hypothetical protein
LCVGRLLGGITDPLFAIPALVSVTRRIPMAPELPQQASGAVRSASNSSGLAFPWWNVHSCLPNDQNHHLNNANSGQNAALDVMKVQF